LCRSLATETIRFTCDVDVNVDLSYRCLRDVYKLLLCNYLLECGLVAWIMGGVVPGRVVGNELRFLLGNVGTSMWTGSGGGGFEIVVERRCVGK
jgi:hypothetical protein